MRLNLRTLPNNTMACIYIVLFGTTGTIVQLLHCTSVFGTRYVSMVAALTGRRFIKK